MTGHYLMLCFFILSVCFVTGTVARMAIVGGHKAELHRFPYQVAIKYRDAHNYRCGGGIIGERFILTAAQCVVNNAGDIIKRHMSILVGTNDLFKTSAPALTMDVSTIYVPEEYLPFFIAPVGDIAILELTQPLRLHVYDHLKKLKQPVEMHNTFVGKTAKITGFGWNWIKMSHYDGHELGGFNDTQLRYADAVILRANETGYTNIRMPEKQIGARVKQHEHSFHPSGTCVGDIGNPLVLGDTVIGVLSKSALGCSEKNDISIYSRVTYYMNIITDVINYRVNPHIRLLDLYQE